MTELPIPGCVNCASETLDFCWITASSDLYNSQFPKHGISSGKCISLFHQAQISNYAGARHGSVRYYSAAKNVTCRNCHRPGHLSKNCPTPKVNAMLKSLEHSAVFLIHLCACCQKHCCSGLCFLWGSALRCRIAQGQFTL